MKKQQPSGKAKETPTATTADWLSQINETSLVAAALALTVVAYLPIWGAQFVNWDDNAYVLNNADLKGGLATLKQLLFNPVQGNYHPLTMLSLALNYAISGLQPWSYHALNLILHLLNTWLVFRLAHRLSQGNLLIAYTVALLFGVHPMHVESVAWVAERKDVLYGFFFLLGLLKYLDYISNTTGRNLMVCLGWFVLSLASKPAAVIFPIVLFLFDAWYRRPVKARVFLEKIPFLLLAGLVGYLTLEGQTAANATDMKDAFDLGNRVQFFFYGFGAYLLKMLAPINLVAFYPFPSVKEALPIAYMLAPVLFVAVAGLCWAARRKYPIVSFGFGFYLLNLLLVLQLITVGHAIIADRYTYIPYIGLFLILAWFVRDWFAGNPAKGLVTVTGLGLILAVVSIFQASTWSNDLALWDNAIQKNPSYMAYCLRGNARQAGGQNDGAMKDYDMALSLRPDYVPALDNRGTLLVRTGKMDQAMADFNLAIQLQQTYKPARMNRATAFMESGNMEAALRDLGQLIRGDADDAEIYNTMGICYQRMAQFDQSIHPFSQAIQLSKTPGTYYLNRSYSWNALGWPENARRDAKEAQKANVTIPSDYAKQIGL